jgi:hypothetical protein
MGIRSIHMQKRSWHAVGLAVIAFVLVQPSVVHAAPDTVAICHFSDSHAAVIDVGPPALAAHLVHGDYVTTLIVDPSADQPADGVHFESLSTALEVVREVRLAHGELLSAACRITIVVAAGEHRGTALEPAAGDIEHFPLVVDVPDVTLRGALLMQLDERARATGLSAGGGETVLRPLEPLPILAGSSTPLILVNAHPGGSAGNRVVVEGFVFRSGHDPVVDAGGQGVLSLRVSGLVIRGNRFEEGFTESIDLRTGSGDVIQNHLSGTAGTCDICLAGPGTFRAVGNRMLAGGIPGVTVDGVVSLPVPSGVEPIVLPESAETSAEILNNEVRDHLRVPVGVGIRIDALGIGAPNVRNTVHAIVRDNLIVNNRFGLIVHAAFPVPNTVRRGDVDVSLGGNVFEQTCQARLLVSLSRHTTALGLSANPYLLDSTFQLDLGGDVNPDAVWYSHPAGFGNTLVIDGQVIANGSRQSYSAVGCPSNES